MALKDIYHNNVVVVQPNTTIKEVSHMMGKYHVGSIIVVKKANGAIRTPIGIVTDRDIALSLSQSEWFDLNKEIKSIMTSKVIVASPEDGIYESIQKMRSNGIRRLPVVNSNEHLVGIVSSDDIMQLLGSELDELSQVQSISRLREGRSVSSRQTSPKKNIKPQATL